ncbi:MAG TPA: M15 family metallopeptidase [Nitrososphaeraceae archaeon]|nr:M15 family metallopeptidase [Nitrososphaeraceae archaeon]
MNNRESFEIEMSNLLRESFDFQRAAEKNRQYSTRLGWNKYLTRINKLLGFTNVSPSENSFARAVYDWQYSNGLKPDGIIGPNSWLKMKKSLENLSFTTNSSSGDNSNSIVISGSEIKFPKGFSPEDLKPEKTPEMTEFKRLVYKISFSRNCCRKDKKTGNLIIKTSFSLRMPDEALGPTTGNIRTRLIKEAAVWCVKLLDAARKQIQREGKVGNITIDAASGYRDASDQFSKWDQRFSMYYNRAVAKKEIVPGLYDLKNANALSYHIGRGTATPGFSDHNRGVAMDFITTQNGELYTTKKEEPNLTLWKDSWFYQWLQRNAALYRFYPRPSINEPWHWVYRPESSVSREVSLLPSCRESVGQTYYLKNINLTVDKKNLTYIDKHRSTGIYVPSSFICSTKANIIVYLHGYKFGYPGENSTIHDYWDKKQFPLFAFREELLKSQKNAILVAPTLGSKSQAGRLIDAQDGGLDWYLGYVLELLQKQGIAKEIGEVVLACHSGGGSPMLRLATINSNKFMLRECWGFDSLYSGYDEKKNKRYTQPDRWLYWAKKNPDKKLFIYYYTSTEKEAVYLEKNKNIRKVHNIYVKKLDTKYAKEKIKDKMIGKKYEKAPHFWVPITYWKDRLSELSWT